MDNNFYMQQNNMQQPMNQPMYQQGPMGQVTPQQPMAQQPMAQQPMVQQPMAQQPMAQPMNIQKPKSKKGLIIGLISAIVLVALAVTITLLAIFVWGSDAELEGKWRSKDGTEVEFEKVIENDDDEDGYIHYSISVDGEKVVNSCPKANNMIVIRSYTEEWSEVDEVFTYIVETYELKIVKLTKNTLVIEFEGDEYEFNRK